MSFSELFTRHVEAIRPRIPHTHGEEATKHALVVPFLQALGYDVYDPREVRPEYTADFAKKKSNGQTERIDYAVCLNGEPVIFFECKAVDAKLDDHDGQLARYFNATPSVHVAILTNGIRIKVFTDLQSPNMMDAAAWLDVDLLAAKPAEIDALRRLRKADFAPDQVVALAEEMVYYNAITAFLSAQLREPSESFVRYIASEIPATGRVTAKVVERLAPILRKSIQSAIVEHVARSFEKPAVPAPAPIAAPVPEATPVPVEARAGVVTTPEEIQTFDVLSGWVREVSPGAAIGYRDSKSYFTIHQNNLRKWCVRLNVQKAPHWVAFRHVTAEELRSLAPGIEIGESAGLGDSRVMLRNPGDLAKLRAPVIAAFEREAARKTDPNEVEGE